MNEKINDKKFNAPISSGQSFVEKKEISGAENEKAGALKNLRESFETLFDAMGGAYARFGEEGFSGDAASIYVLVSLKNKKGEEVPDLVKIGWGEFSKNTFESGKYPAFKNFPFDIYCVSQSDSYFADEKLRKEMAENPKKYLAEHSLFAASNGKVQLSKRVDDRARFLEREINAVPYDEMLRAVRNQMINAKTAQKLH